MSSLFLRDDCKQCPEPAPCNCTADEECVLLSRSCDTCSRKECQPRALPSAGGGGVSKGALAGAVIASLILLTGAVLLFLWYRRRSRAAKRGENSENSKPDVPAAAEDVLSRPDPIEKHLSYVPHSSPINQDQASHDHHHPSSRAPVRSMSRDSVQSNPFTDTHSIQTTRTEGTNAIPIALANSSFSQHTGDSGFSNETSPLRPPRTPEMDLNLDHVNVSDDSLRVPTQGGTSVRSGTSGISASNPNRMSYMTNASYSSDFLEAPMIVTTQSRQMLNVAKAEMVSAPPSQHGSMQSSSLTVPATRTTLGSPLAMSSFGPSDVLREEEEEGQQASYPNQDPFGDEHSPLPSSRFAPPSAGTTTTFGDQPTAPPVPWSKHDGSSRPASISTQAGSVIDFGNATRVNVGLRTLGSAGTATPRSPFRTTMGKLVTPPSTAGLPGMGHEQQQGNGEHLGQSSSNVSHRASVSSAISTSTRADSILESFPFVPPSPISNRPIRSPPVSPLGKQSFGGANQAPSESQGSTSTTANDPELAPPNRRLLGMSTASQSSTVSNGLGSFPFQIEDGNGAPPSAFNNNFSNEPSSRSNGANVRQRASLDTLALTSDLSSYPLGFDNNENRPMQSK